MSSKPNILLIGCESMDGRVMGHVGDQAVQTPTLDALAAAGTSFTSAYTNCPLCSPSRSSMWSGQHLHTIGCWNNYTGLTPSHVTMATLLAEAGYRVGDYGRRDKSVGRHNGPDRFKTWFRRAALPLHHVPPHPAEVLEVDYANPWDRNNFDGDEPWEADMNLVDWLADAAKDERPFFGHFGIGAVHTGLGFRAARRYVVIDPATVPMPPRETPQLEPLRVPNVLKNCPAEMSDEYIRACRLNYRANIAEVDELVRNILQVCETIGIRDNTWIIFISDHGDMLMEHGGGWGKNNMYDAACRVPLIIVPPKGHNGPRGQLVDRPVSLIDMLPTICDLAEAKIPEHAVGHSLLPNLKSTASTHPGEVIIQFHGNQLPGSCYAYINQDWKYTEYEWQGQLLPQLFDRNSDPEEIHNLVEEQGSQAKDCATKLRHHVDVEQTMSEKTDLDRRSAKHLRSIQSAATFRSFLEQECYTHGPVPFSQHHFEQLQQWIDAK